MPENLETTTKEENEAGNREEQAEADIQGFLFSETMSSLCYWTTILLLAITGAYLIRWRFIHSVAYSDGVNDPWGVATPPWLVESLAPVGVVLSLAQAVWREFQGQRRWKMIMTSAILIAVLTCSKLFEIYLR